MLIHGHCSKNKKSKTYSIWTTMKSRCNNPNTRQYRWYGAKGIKVCNRWLKFENFLEDMGEAPKNLTIERQDNNKGYSPDNCIWETWEVQRKNKKSKKLPIYYQKKVFKAKADKLKTRYNHSIINTKTGQLYYNQVALGKVLNLTRQAVSLYFTRNKKKSMYLYYKEYLINRWRNVNILLKLRVI